MLVEKHRRVWYTGGMGLLADLMKVAVEINDVVTEVKQTVGETVREVASTATDTKNEVTSVATDLKNQGTQTKQTLIDDVRRQTDL